MRDAGFKAAQAHVAILDKGQRSVKGLNPGSEGIVTLDLILTVRKPERSERAAAVIAAIDRAEHSALPSADAVKITFKMT